MVKQSKLFCLLMKTATRYIVSLPVFGLVFAVLWSVLFDLERATATHCHVTNYLPSVSAAISMSPQSYVWRACIALHTTPRYLFSICHWKLHSYYSYKQTKSKMNEKQEVICFADASINIAIADDERSFIKPLKATALIANLIELSTLLGLTLISSRENFSIHKTCFILFIIGSLCCMISMCLLNTMVIMEKDNQKQSARRKKICLLINIISLLVAVYFYYRHNTFCEHGVYTLFALSEYTVIISNISFHYTASLDFEDYSLCILDTDERKL